MTSGTEPGELCGGPSVRAASPGTVRILGTSEPGPIHPGKEFLRSLLSRVGRVNYVEAETNLFVEASRDEPVRGAAIQEHQGSGQIN